MIIDRVHELQKWSAYGWGNKTATPLLGSEHQSCSPYPFMLLTELSKLTFPMPVVHKSHMQPGSHGNNFVW